MELNTTEKQQMKKDTKIINNNNNIGKLLKVYGSAILFSLIVGLSFLCVKISVQLSSPLETLTFRYNFAALASIVPLLFGFIKLGVKRQNLKILLMVSSFHIGFVVLQAIALMYSTSIVSGIMFAITPILVRIIAHIFIGEKGNWKQNIFVTISVASVIVLVIMGAQGFKEVNIAGMILLFLSSLSMAVGNVVMRHVRHLYTPYSLAFTISVCGCILINIVALFKGITNGTLGEYFSPLLHWEFLLSTAFLGILSTMLTVVLMAYMLAHIEAVKATIFGNLSTAMSIIIGVVVLHEPFFIYQAICTILIIIGVIGTSVTGREKQVKVGEEKEELYDQVEGNG